MSRLRLEVFTAAPTPGTPGTLGHPATVVTDTVAFEEAKLSAYEQGYNAGWEDANNADSADQIRIRADLSRSVQALAFTYHEARAHVLSAIEPLLTHVLAQILPEVARESLPAKVLEVLAPLAREMADTPVRVMVSPATRPAVESIFGKGVSLPVEMVEELALADGQVTLVLAQSELRVDLDEAVAATTSAIRSYFTLLNQELRHG